MTPNPSLYCVSVSNSVDCTVHLVLRSKSAGEKVDKRDICISVSKKWCKLVNEWMI